MSKPSKLSKTKETKETKEKKAKNETVYLDLGNGLLEVKEYETALLYFEKAVKQDPKSDQALFGIACCQYELNLGIEKVLHNITNALKLNPAAQYFDFAAMAFFISGNHEVALRYQIQANNLSSTYQSLSNLSDMYKKLGHIKKAMDIAEYMVIASPYNLDSVLHCAALLLLQGEYEKGWALWEYRRKRKFLCRTYKKPYWDGSDLTGKTIFLYCEQGFGDTIQFVRFVPLVKQNYENVKIIFEFTPPIKDLLSQISCADETIMFADNSDNSILNKEFDYHCSILSLPHYLKNTLEYIPYPDGYLEADRVKEARWKSLLNTKLLKVGIVWHGSTTVDDRRNIPLREFIPLLYLEDIQFYSLQLGEASKQIKGNGLEEKIIDYTDEFIDFSDTAAFIKNLDLVIGVDTSVIHLSGALGKTTWLMSRMDGCWRWMSDREDSPWYSSVSIYRQKTWLGWSHVFDKIKLDLVGKEIRSRPSDHKDHKPQKPHRHY